MQVLKLVFHFVILFKGMKVFFSSMHMSHACRTCSTEKRPWEPNLDQVLCKSKGVHSPTLSTLHSLKKATFSCNQFFLFFPFSYFMSHAIFTKVVILYSGLNLWQDNGQSGTSFIYIMIFFSGLGLWRWFNLDCYSQCWTEYPVSRNDKDWHPKLFSDLHIFTTTHAHWVTFTSRYPSIHTHKD